MHGLIGKMMAVPGERDRLVEILVDGVAGMPGCLSYVVAVDPGDENAIWVTEVWESRESHEKALTMAPVQQAIAEGRPLIADMTDHVVTVPIGGHGMTSGGGSSA